MLDVLPIPCLADNYAWALVSPPVAAGAPRAAVVVDPGEAAPVAAALAAGGLRLEAIWLTHHHGDHTFGVAELTAAAGGRVEVVGAAADRHRLPPLSRAVEDGTTWRALGSEVRVLSVPGHTRAAVAFHLPDEAALFTGDTLFLAGCGRLLEGTAEQMRASLARLGALPGATRIFCGHEYTAKNLAFAGSLCPSDPALAARQAKVAALRARGLPSVPATLAEERATNPFLRAAAPEILAAVGADDPASAFAELRRRRDRF